MRLQGWVCGEKFQQISIRIAKIDRLAPNPIDGPAWRRPLDDLYPRRVQMRDRLLDRALPAKTDVKGSRLQGLGHQIGGLVQILLIDHRAAQFDGQYRRFAISKALQIARAPAQGVAIEGNGTLHVRGHDDGMVDGADFQGHL